MFDLLIMNDLQKKSDRLLASRRLKVGLFKRTFSLSAHRLKGINKTLPWGL
jgi:hypothetical protein